MAAATDTEPPLWPERGANLGIRARTATTMTLTWEPAFDNVGIAYYEVYSAPFQEGAWDWADNRDRVTLLGTVPTEPFVVTGLVETTVYTFFVRAIDAAGNSSIISAPLHLRTADETPPSVPTGLTVVDEWTTSDSLYLRWNPSTDNMVVAHYDVFIDGARYHLFYEPEGEIVRLSLGKTYAITIVAIDAEGNSSAPSEALQVSTRDTTPPGDIHSIRLVERTATSATITWDPVVDNNGPVTYEIVVDRQDNIIATTTENSYTLTGLTEDSSVMLGVYVRDAAGNRSLSWAIILL